MKIIFTVRFFLISFLFSFCAPPPLFAQENKDENEFSLFFHQKKFPPGANFSSSACVNADFEQCDFSTWTLIKGSVSSSPASPYSFINPDTTGPGVQHFIQSGGIDNVVNQADTPFSLSKVFPDNGSCSAMIGDSFLTGYGASRLIRTFMVDSSNAVFLYRYAAVLQDPSSHSVKQKPYFSAQVFDESGNAMPCGDYNIVAGNCPPSSGCDPTFTAVTYNGETLYYKDWTTGFVPLTNYIGQNVTVQFTSGDCAQGGHFGYAYVETACLPLEIVSSSPVICGGQSVTLTAPPGGASYSWTGPGGFTASSQVITTSSPGTYNVVITHNSGSACAITLSATLSSNTALPVANFSFSQACVGTPVFFTDLSSTVPGSIVKWMWNFGVNGNGDTSDVPNPSFVYDTNGIFSVSLTITTNSGCIKDTTIEITVDTSFDANFLPDTFCSNDAPQNLSAAMSGGTWLGTGITDSLAGTFDPSVSGIGTFPVIYFGGMASCKDSFSTDILVEGVTLTSVLSTNISCFDAGDGTMEINSPDSVEFSIDNGTGPIVQPDGLFSNLPYGNYFITVSSLVNDCQVTAYEQILEPPPITIIPFNDTSICSSGTALIGATASGGNGAPYSYYVNNIPITDPDSFLSVSPVIDECYSIFATDSMACSSVTKIQCVTVSPPLSGMTTGNSTICIGSSADIGVVASGGKPGNPYSFLWSNGDPDQFLSVSPTGDSSNPAVYYVTVSDGCSPPAIDSIIITFYPGINLTTSVSPDTTGSPNCSGWAEAFASGSTGPYVFIWSSGQDTSVAGGLCAGYYTITVVDSFGCSTFDTAFISPVTSLKKISNDYEFITVFPNPSQGKVFFSRNSADEIEITIYSMLGEKIYKDVIPGRYGALDFSQYSEGMYIILFSGSDQNQNVKLILRK